MSDLLRNGLIVVTLLCAVSACDRGPTAPTPPAPPPRPPQAGPGAAPNAARIAVGETISGVVSLSDPLCEPGHPADPPEPCQRFAIAIPTSGVLRVHVTSRGPYGFTLGIGALRQWGATVIASVQAGSTYEISVALHGVIAGLSSQAFELTTSLEPQ